MTTIGIEVLNTSLITYTEIDQAHRDHQDIHMQVHRVVYMLEIFRAQDGGEV